ncbi:hypothetical protein ColLi_08808 [Colletotrichum liriopes]|uniref:DUF4045 domain-containing protein n=1 Tax=Colletotrichum liriopes TaxID=708192 RepID=A0AA37GRR6_9PEZI|nr:hypothetical protein ColLi_08808 [Colletotrichum liriopes]
MSEQAMDDVSKFLQDVKEMNARRTEEDDARQRELDEKIQQEKRERQARRAASALLSSAPRPASLSLPSLSAVPSALFYKLSFPDVAKAQILLRVVSCPSGCSCSCSRRAMFRFRLPSTRKLSY